MVNKSPFNENKILRHPEQIKAWLEKGWTLPIGLDIDLTNRCQHNCPGCLSAFNREDQEEIPFEKAKELIEEFGQLGIKAINFGGGGEPTHHPRAAELIRLVKKNGMELGIFTNGSDLSDDLIDAIINSCTWVRISLDAGSPQVYRITHGMKDDSYQNVLDNLKRLVKKRNESGRDVKIGTSYLIGSHTIHDIYNAAKNSKECGVDYFRARPFEYIPGTELNEDRTQRLKEQLEMCKELEDENFNVSFPKVRVESRMEGNEQSAFFNQCHFPQVYTSISADLKIHPCCHFKNSSRNARPTDNIDPKLGDLTNRKFLDVWTDLHRINTLKSLNISTCPNPCQYNSSVVALYQIKEAGIDRLSEFTDQAPDPIMHENFL
jgi:MoaA/NifB/PqqE/SkfB family radical SAM enzyme